jgi:hypothetical protein
MRGDFMRTRTITTAVGTRFSVVAVLLVALGAGLFTAPAHAVKPLVIEDIRFDGVPVVDEFFSEECGFPVEISTRGHFRGTVFFDKDGEFRLFTGHPSFRDTFSSPYATIEASDRGLDKYSITSEGDLLVFGTGIHLRVKGAVYAIGLWRLTFDLETDELVAQEYHGRFDVQQPEIVDAICSLLGPPAS